MVDELSPPMIDKLVVKKMIRQALAGLLLLTFSSTAFAVVPDDHVLRSLMVVKSADQADMNWGGFPVRRSRDMLMITFVSEYDVRAISQHGEFTITPIASLCDRPKIDASRKLHGDAAVYDQHGYIDPSGDDGNSYLRVRSRHNTLYHIYRYEFYWPWNS